MSRRIAVFCMPDGSHVRRLQSVISRLAALGDPVHVFTGRQFQRDVERVGGTFVDLFAGRSIELADDESMPMPCRLVSFAGRYAGEICDEVASLAPSLIVHDTFAVIGWVVADRLGIPRVNVCAGHNVEPRRFIADLGTDPRVRISPRCYEAVHLLRTRYGVEDASPFSYVAGLSRDLNLYCEPPLFLADAERLAFEPLVHYGSLPDSCAIADAKPTTAARSGLGNVENVYICFGTIVWRYYKADALRALTVLSRWFSRQPHLRVVISLGGATVDDRDRAALEQPNVSVHTEVDQWSLLAQSDCFITHHGLNSTHEAIFHRVAMISFPFFWDQPALAARCQALGLAIPLTDVPRGEVSGDHIDTAWRRYLDQRSAMRTSLDAAREWELDVIAGRGAVLDRIRSLG